ncbi:ankyrin [Hypoxylon sp. EC38]|nr:ankyrin [Hypoxylon sp. EC38]
MWLLSRRNASIARELHVLTTPALRGNSYILSLLGYGWDKSALGRRPYVIVEYSEHGTLSDYLQQTYDTITATECRELALDVALGLQVIHDIKIIHGDVKPENILIFSILHEDRLKVAKLADFGGSLFEEDQHEQATYGGTPLYNASDWRALEHFYLADGQTVLESSVLSTFTLTLMDDPYQRSNMSQIVNTLSQGCTRRPTANRVQTSIDSSPASEQESLSQEDAISSPVISPFQTLPTSQTRFAQKVVVAGIFGSVRTLQTHWEIQCNVFNDLSNSVNSNSAYRPSLTYYSNCLHLALTYHVGFGVRPDNSSTVRYLGMSALGNYVAEALYHRISSSTDKKPRFEEIGWPLFTSLDRQLKDYESDETYFKRRITLLQQTWASETLLTLRNSDDDAKEAVELCARCLEFITKPSQPTPVHWLTMSDDQEAYRLSSALINGLSGNTSGPCRDCLNFSPTITEHDLFYPEHCLELGGTPLHWAVKTRNRVLVQSLLSLGADPNIRWANPARTSVDRENPSLSTLDIAVKFHLYDIVELLLDYGADRSTSPHDTLDFHHSAIHCIGLPCVPLARRVIHGMNYRAAIKKTIHILVNRGFDVNDPTPDGDTPLIVALRWSDCEEYIIEELLAAGARTTSIGLNNISNAAVATTKACISRRYSVTNLRRVAPLVRHHINDLDEFGRNALHYAAGIAASGEAVQITSEVEGFDANIRSLNGLHAIYYAALFDCCDSIPILVAHGVDIDAPVVNKNFGQYPFTALMSAAGRKNKKTTDSLLRYGANPNFSFLESLYIQLCSRPPAQARIRRTQS